MREMKNETGERLLAAASAEECELEPKPDTEGSRDEVDPQQSRQAVERAYARRRFIVRKSHWKAITAIDPRLAQSPHREVLLALLNDARTEDGGILLDCYTISQAVHHDRICEPHWRDHHINIEQTLKDIKAWTGSSFSVTNPDWEEGIARVVRSFTPGPRLAAAIYTKSAGDLARYGLVDIVTGKPCSPEHAKAYWHEMQSAINVENEGIREPVIRAFAGYLNNTLTWGNFKYQQCDVDAVLAAIDAQFRASTVREGTTGRQRRHQYAAATTARRVLGDLLLWPQPLYRRSSRSPRLHPKGNSLIGLPTSLRRMLKPNVIEYDLVSSQMAVFAKVADIPELLDLLHANIRGDGSTWWDYCFAACGIERPTPQLRSVLKRVSYSIVFGMAKGRLFRPRRTKQGWHLDDEEMRTALGQFTPAMQERFFSDPLIVRILAARDKMLRRIKKDGGMHDAWNTWVAIDMDNSNEKFDQKSVLAYVCQSYEMRILEGVMQLAMEMFDDPHGFRIIAWQHDGYSVIMNRAADEPHISSLIHAAVCDEAERLGIPAGVEVKYDGITGKGERRVASTRLQTPLRVAELEAPAAPGPWEAKGSTTRGERNEEENRWLDRCSDRPACPESPDRPEDLVIQLLPSFEFDTLELPSNSEGKPALCPSPAPAQFSILDFVTLDDVEAG